MNCRPHCAACCIAPSITSPLPGLSLGKPGSESREQAMVWLSRLERVTSPQV